MGHLDGDIFPALKSSEIKQEKNTFIQTWAKNLHGVQKTL